jgi:hypothetical protein
MAGVYTQTGSRNYFVPLATARLAGVGCAQNHIELFSDSLWQVAVHVAHTSVEEVAHMPITTELAIRMENRPGSLGKVCRALADRGVNIMALQSIPAQNTILVCLVADNPAAARSVLDNAGIFYTESEVAEARLPNRPGELARPASQLGEANININYAYCGVEPGTNVPLVIFGITEVGRAATILDQPASAAARS